MAGRNLLFTPPKSEVLATALRRLGDRAEHEGRAAIFGEAEAIMTLSKSRYVPVDLGTLRASGHVEPPEVVGNVITVLMAYGGPAARYAVFVHEIPPPPATSPSGRSARHRPPTQYKYLERAAQERVQGMESRLAARLQAALR